MFCRYKNAFLLKVLGRDFSFTGLLKYPVSFLNEPPFPRLLRSNNLCDKHSPNTLQPFLCTFYLIMHLFLYLFIQSLAYHSKLDRVICLPYVFQLLVHWGLAYNQFSVFVWFFSNKKVINGILSAFI